MSDSLQPHGLYGPWNSPSQNPRVGSLSLLQGIFPPQGWNPGLLHCRRILYQQSHQGIPRILEWAAYPFCSGSSRPRNRTQGLLHCKRILYQRFAFLLTLERFSPLSRSPMGFPGGSDGKESSCNAGDLGCIPGLGTSPGEGNGYPLQCSCLENSMGRGA